MLPALLITFRETLEASLVIGVVLSFLFKTEQSVYAKFVWRGIAAGLEISIVLAFAIDFFFGELEGPAEPLFEGILMFITVGFLTWMILWVHRQKDISAKIKERVAKHAKAGYGMGIFILVMTSVFREGTETVLYLKASSLVGQSDQLIGAIIGISLALALGYELFRWATRVRLSLVFAVTNVFLLLFAAGLVAHGVHEFQEIGILPIFSFDPTFNISAVLDHRSLFGSILSTLFGYTSKPTLLELVSYALYIVGILYLERMTDRMLFKNSSRH